MQFEEGNNHFSFGGWTADYNDPMDFFQSYLVTELWENKEYDVLLEEAKFDLDVKKRDELLLKAEQLMMDEMPIIPLYFGSNNWVQAEMWKVLT